MQPVHAIAHFRVPAPVLTLVCEPVTHWPYLAVPVGSMNILSAFDCSCV